MSLELQGFYISVWGRPFPFHTNMGTKNGHSLGTIRVPPSGGGVRLQGVSFSYSARTTLEGRASVYHEGFLRKTTVNLNIEHVHDGK